MKERFSQIAVFQYSSQAQVIKSRLEADDIEVFLYDQFTVDTDPLVSNAIGGIKLKVWAEDEAEARRILDSISQYSLDNTGEKIRCPVCNSQKIDLFTNVRTVKSFFAFLFSFATTTLPIHTRYEYRCDNCGKKFNSQ